MTQPICNPTHVRVRNLQSHPVKFLITLRKVDEVVDGEVLPHDLPADRPTDDEVAELREPRDPHDHEQLQDDLDLLQRLGALALLPRQRPARLVASLL